MHQFCKMAAILDHDFIEFLDLLEEEDAEREPRLPRRYLRDNDNPLEHYSDQQFRKRYRFTKNTVIEAILPLVEFQEHGTRRGLPIPPILQILCALRFYATGDFQIVLGDLRKINQSTVSRIIRRVSTGIAQRLQQFVKFPSTEQEYASNRNLFYEMSQFPGVTGVIDCTHIPIQSPGGQFAELYRNRKGWMSLNVQLICGPQMEIMDIVSRWPGSTHDSRIFENSAIRQKFVDGRVHGILLGDNGYPQLPYLFTPILDHHVRIPAERRYNRAHKSTSNIIERLNGLWKQRFPCLRRKLLTKAVTTQAIIVACAILHNIGILRQDHFENVEEVPAEDVPVANANVGHNPQGSVVRQQFIERHFY